MRELVYEWFPTVRALVNFVNKNRIKRENVQYVGVKENDRWEILYWKEVKGDNSDDI